MLYIYVYFFLVSQKYVVLMIGEVHKRLINITYFAFRERKCGVFGKMRDAQNSKKQVLTLYITILLISLRKW